MRLNTPVNGFQSFELHRAAFDEIVTIKLPSGETYIVEVEELKKWLKDVKVEAGFIDKVVDLVWNFRRLRYDLREQRAVTL